MKKEGFSSLNARALTFSENSYDMLIWELVLLFSGVTSVSLWNEAKEGLVFEVINKAKPSFGFVDSFEKEKLIRRFSKIKLNNKKKIREIIEKKADLDFVLNSIDGIEPDTEAFVQFTSGSTGEMKGVVLSHKDICSQQKAFSLIWEIPSDSVFLSYLPWYHSYGGLFERFIAINYGVSWYLNPEVGKDIEKLFFYWEKVKPTHFSVLLRSMWKF